MSRPIELVKLHQITQYPSGHDTIKNKPIGQVINNNGMNSERRRRTVCGANKCPDFRAGNVAPEDSVPAWT